MWLDKRLCNIRPLICVTLRSLFIRMTVLKLTINVLRLTLHSKVRKKSIKRNQNAVILTALIVKGLKALICHFNASVKSGILTWCVLWEY